VARRVLLQALREVCRELFTFSEARDYLLFDEDRLSVAFSKLHSKRILQVFDRGRPRLYRLLDPEDFLFLASGAVRNVDKIASERYLKLVLDCLRLNKHKVIKERLPLMA